MARVPKQNEKDMTRRRVLSTSSIAVGSAVAGCLQSEDGTDEGGDPPPTPEVGPPDPDATEGATIVEDGTGLATIVTPAEPPEPIAEAAEELITHVTEMTGVELPIRTESETVAAERIPIRLGTAASDDLVDMIRGEDAEADPESFALSVTDEEIEIRSFERPEGTRHGTYELLEQLGVRWFAPRELQSDEFDRLYTVIPDADTLVVPSQAEVQIPSFVQRDTRLLREPESWRHRMRMPGDVETVGKHLLDPLGRGYDEDDPDDDIRMYAEIDGERVGGKAYCYSNPDTLERVVDHIVQQFEDNPDMDKYTYAGGRHDSSTWCECDGSDHDGERGCIDLDGSDWDPYANELSITDRNIWFYNRILERFDEELPDKELRIAFYFYGNTFRPPKRWEPDSRLRPTMAPLHLCRWHGATNDVCVDKRFEKTSIEEWSSHVDSYNHRGYFYNVAGIGAPYPLWHRLSEEIPLHKELGVERWSPGTRGNWGSSLPSHYIMAKLFWNHEADVEELMRDFLASYFGPAYEPMAEYYWMMEDAVVNGDYHTGSSRSVQFFYDQEFRKTAFELFDTAEQRIQESADPDPIYADRVQLDREILEYVDAYARMMDAKPEHRWKESFEAYEELEAQRKMFLEKYETGGKGPIEDRKYGGQNARRFTDFLSLPTRSAYERVTGKNEFIVGTEDEWQFYIDRFEIGEEHDFYAEEITGGNWQTYRTSRTWSMQGLHHYRGEAWYRQRITVPDIETDDPIYLWFGGVDGEAKVWLNGDHLGNSHTSAFRPFEFDVTDSVNFGEENVIAVRVSETDVDEVGTGGLTDPAFFYRRDAGFEPEYDWGLADEFPSVRGQAPDCGFAPNGIPKYD